jgi:L-malate glycosyltransferase
VAARVGGVPEVIVDGESGLLFPPADEAMAINLCLELLSDAAAYAAMSRAAIRRARQFDVDAIVPMYETLYARHQPRQRTRPFALAFLPGNRSPAR